MIKVRLPFLKFGYLSWFMGKMEGGGFFARVGKCGFTIQAPSGISHMWKSFLYFVQSTRGKVQRLTMTTIIGRVNVNETRGSIAVYRMPFNVSDQATAWSAYQGIIHTKHLFVGVYASKFSARSEI